MNLVFLNTMEKQTEEGRVVSARIGIAEEQGQWGLIWIEPAQDGTMSEQRLFAGASWNELLQAFREQVCAKLAEGYMPLLEAFSAEDESERFRALQMLYYYSEQHVEDKLYEELRQWRRRTAEARKAAPYVVANNRLLRCIAAFIPHKEEELLQMPGFGRKRAEQYGESILKLTREYAQTVAYPLDPAALLVDEQQFMLWQNGQKQLRAKAERDRAALKNRLLAAIGRGDTVEAMVKDNGMPLRELLMLLEELHGNGYDVLPAVDSYLASVEQSELDKAWAAFEAKGDRYLRPILQELYSEEELKGKPVDGIYGWLRLLRIRFRSRTAALGELAG